MGQSVDSWRQRVGQLRTEACALHLAYKDPRVPWYAKILPALVVAHILSPMDLIPDFFPVLGYLDDLVIAPVGIALALTMIPEDVMAESRNKAHAVVGHNKPMGWVAAAVTIVIWLFAAELAIAAL